MLIPGQVEIQVSQVALPVYAVGRAFCGQCGVYGLHAGQRQRQERSAMGHYEPYVRIPSGNVACNHVYERACCLCRVFIHGEGYGIHHFSVHGHGLVRVQYYHCAAFVEHVHERVECSVAKILPAAVGGQLYAVGAECVEGIYGFVYRGLYVGKRKRRAEKELAGTGGFKPGAFVVVIPYNALALVAVSEIRLRGGH